MREALVHAGLFHDEILISIGSSPKGWKSEDVAARLRDADGIVVPGGFGYRSIEGKIAAARFARESKVPSLGCAWACRS